MTAIKIAIKVAINRKVDYDTGDVHLVKLRLRLGAAINWKVELAWEVAHTQTLTPYTVCKFKKGIVFPPTRS